MRWVLGCRKFRLKGQNTTAVAEATFSVLKRTPEFAGKRINGRRLDWCLFFLLDTFERRLVDKAREKADGACPARAPHSTPPLRGCPHMAPLGRTRHVAYYDALHVVCVFVCVCVCVGGGAVGQQRGAAAEGGHCLHVMLRFWRPIDVLSS